jgi:class 3 adenylate cyclase
MTELKGGETVAPELTNANIAPVAPHETAERRQMTVMFSDLVGSAALSGCIDPEDLREVISAYQKCVADNVQRFGGFVAKYMGDGVLIHFGYPHAHEDDAKRQASGRGRGDRYVTSERPHRSLSVLHARQ